MTETFQRYQQHYTTQSDIQHHLGLLFSLARGNVLELGTRGGVSTAALLAGVERHGGHVWSVDIEDCSQVAAGHPQWTFIQGRSEIAGAIEASMFPSMPVESDPLQGTPGDYPDGYLDVLMIDTEHTYEQASAELAAWAHAMTPGSVILMHDPETFPGVRRAAQEFADAHNWPITFVLPCHGMAVIVRPMEGVSAEGASWAAEQVRV